MPNTVNLFCATRPLPLNAADSGTAVVDVGNFGPDDACGPVSLKVVVPYYATVSELPSVPGSRAGWLYRCEDAGV